MDDYYARILYCNPHRHRKDQFFYSGYPQYDLWGALRPMFNPDLSPVAYKANSDNSDEENEDISLIEKAVEAKLKAAAEYEKVKGKFEEAKKSLEESEAKLRAATKKLEKARKFGRSMASWTHW